MSTLHIISKVPSSQLLLGCLSTLSKDDAILFIEDGVYHCLKSDLLDLIPEENSVLGLREDLAARGAIDKCLPRAESVSYRDFVELSIQHEKTLSWF